MLYEIRTYRLKPGSLKEVEKRFGDTIQYRVKYSPLLAFWHTEIGPLNEIVHVWPYESLAERARIRSSYAKDPNWPPKVQEFIENMQAEVVVPFPFLPEPQPGKLGPIYEMRIYTIKAGTLPDMMKGWESKIGERTKFSPLVLAGNVDLGEANRFIHIWGYTGLDQRATVRAQAVAAGAWPPGGGGDRLISQANKILLPAAFSPLQ